MRTGVFDAQSDEGLGQGLEAEAVVDGLLQRRGILRGDALALVGAILPDLMFEVGPGLGAGGARAVLGLETAEFHGIQGGHLLEECGAFGEENVIHWKTLSSN